jgi:O-antigen/teichoic acid export membrane protein
MFAQAMGLPLSFLMNGVMGHKLGAAAVGQYYLATSYAGFAFLFVEWGLGGVLPAAVARDRSRAASLLGSALLWRIGTAPLAAAAIAVIALFLEPGLDFQISLALVCLATAFGLVWRTCGDVVRGFERAEVAAYSYVGGQILNVALMVPIMLLGGGLHVTLIGSAAAAGIVLIPVWRALRPAGVGKLSVDFTATKKLLIEGNSFMVLSVILMIQPAIDAALLGWMTSHEVVGWHAAAKRLQGALIYPSSALIGALYPTLARLWVENRAEFARTTTGALRACIVVMVPLAVGCYLFAELGIRLFSKEAFGPAVKNLQILSAFVLMLYLTMTIGTCLAAAGRQRAWTMAGCLKVAVQTAGTWLFIPWFQRREGNGGLAVSWATALGEALMLVIGLAMMPRGIFDRSIVRTALQAAAAGGAMVVVARLLPNVTQFVVAPLAGLAYLVVLYAVGGIDKSQIESVKGMVRRKILRR